MNPEQENFEKLTRLMSLKRHEQPPPGYFNHFSREVIARIRAGEKSSIHNYEGISWVKRFWSAMEGRPSLAGAFGAAVCGLLLAGIVYSQKAESGAGSVIEPATVETAAVGAPDTSTPVFAGPAPIQPANAILGATGGVFAPQVTPSLFKQFKEMDKAWVLPANYTAPGRN